ncbi:MAG: hypothetical protein EBZ26_03760 [Flavobacteriia bacterium]|nr:hypothetical protein [Flavobacteriia bacterium]
MSKITEVGEDTVLGVSIKTLIALAIGLSVAVGMYYDVKGEIEIAKQLPEPAVSRTEFDLKDELVRETIMTNAKNIEEWNHAQALARTQERRPDLLGE